VLERPCSLSICRDDTELVPTFSKRCIPHSAVKRTPEADDCPSSGFPCSMLAKQVPCSHLTHRLPYLCCGSIYLAVPDHCSRVAHCIVTVNITVLGLCYLMFQKHARRRRVDSYLAVSLLNYLTFFEAFPAPQHFLTTHSFTFLWARRSKPEYNYKCCCKGR
jgi:hypothetical protein